MATPSTTTAVEQSFRGVHHHPSTTKEEEQMDYYDEEEAEIVEIITRSQSFQTGMCTATTATKEKKSTATADEEEEKDSDEDLFDQHTALLPLRKSKSSSAGGFLRKGRSGAGGRRMDPIRESQSSCTLVDSFYCSGGGRRSKLMEEQHQHQQIEEAIDLARGDVMTFRISPTPCAKPKQTEVRSPSPILERTCWSAPVEVGNDQRGIEEGDVCANGDENEAMVEGCTLNGKSRENSWSTPSRLNIYSSCNNEGEEESDGEEEKDMATSSDEDEYAASEPAPEPREDILVDYDHQEEGGQPPPASVDEQARDDNHWLTDYINQPFMNQITSIAPPLPQQQEMPFRPLMSNGEEDIPMADDHQQLGHSTSIRSFTQFPPPPPQSSSEKNEVLQSPYDNFDYDHQEVGVPLWSQQRHRRFCRSPPLAQTDDTDLLSDSDISDLEKKVALMGQSIEEINRTVAVNGPASFPVVDHLDGRICSSHSTPCFPYGSDFSMPPPPQQQRQRRLLPRRPDEIAEVPSSTTHLPYSATFADAASFSLYNGQQAIPLPFTTTPRRLPSIPTQMQQEAPPHPSSLEALAQGHDLAGISALLLGPHHHQLVMGDHSLQPTGGEKRYQLSYGMDASQRSLMMEEATMAVEDSYYEDGLNGNLGPVPFEGRRRRSNGDAMEAMEGEGEGEGEGESSGVSSCCTSTADGQQPTNSNSNPSTGPTHRAQFPFCPRHPGEIHLEVGDALKVEQQCEDHWCVGVNLRSGQKGIFPSAHICEVDLVDEICRGALTDNKEQQHRQHPATKNDNTRALKHDNDTFYVTMLATIEVAHHKGNDVLLQAINKVCWMYQQKEEILVPQTVLMEVSFRGIHVIDKRKKDFFRCPTFDYFYSLQNISFCGAHPAHLNYFAFITKHPLLPRFACHVFLSSESTQPIVDAIGRAFRRSYDEYMAFAHPTEDIFIE